MKTSTRSVLRKLGTDEHLESERQQFISREVDAARNRQPGGPGTADGTAPSLADLPEEMLSESEKRHEKYRRQQAVAGRVAPAAERLPIMTAEERRQRDRSRPKWTQTPFEGPIEKLIEKYGDIAEVRKHLTLGQSMKYESTEDGQVLDRDGNLIWDGQRLVGKA
jgi:hypothetical protein